MILTKYFNAESNWSDYEKGSFKLGTLEEYRESEGDLARMTDRGEGEASDGYGEGGGYIHELRRSGLIFRNITTENVNIPYEVKQTFNEHVFCASIGEYSPEHHKRIRKGETLSDGSEYFGNSDLDAYAEIDLNKFLQALRFWAAGADDVSNAIELSKIVFGKEVVYGERMTRNPFISDGEMPTISVEAYQRAIFHKPKAYRIENEFRIVVRCNAPYSAARGASAKYPCTRRLKRSIISIGHQK